MSDINCGCPTVPNCVDMLLSLLTLTSLRRWVASKNWNHISSNVPDRCFFFVILSLFFESKTEASFSAGAHSNLDAWRDMKGRFRSTESKQKLLLRCRDAHREDCSLHVFERPVKPLTDPMLHNGQVPTRHEMLILGGVFCCPVDRPCVMFVLGRCLAVSCSFLLPLGEGLEN